jgi:hypothetical protein
MILSGPEAHKQDEERNWTMIDPELRDQANEIIDRLFALDEAIANARAFRSLLEDLHARDLTIVKEPHVGAIKIVRAGILRALVGTVMACLDPSDRRGNRASVGQILDMLNDPELVAAFREPGGISAASQGAALDQVRGDYDAVIRSDLFNRGRRLRNEGIAHILMTSTPTPTVTYETIYGLHDEAEQFAAALYRVCDRGKPRFDEHRPTFEASAKVFWDTYFQEVRM